jgi:hypothetical protein
MMHGAFTAAEYAVWDAPSTDLADMGLFWGGDDKLVLSPQPPEDKFLSDILDALGYRNVHVIWPNSTNPSLCDAIVEDPSVYALLVDTLRQSHLPQVLSWGSTPQLYRLLESLKQDGCEFTTPDIPAPDTYWLSLYLDSKSGFREVCLALQSDAPDIRLPEAFTCGTKDLAVEAINHFWSRGRAFAAKASFGTGGFSMLAYAGEKLTRSLEWIQRDMRRRMSYDHFWDVGPVLVEEYLYGPSGGTPAAPTIDLLISSDGTVSVQGAGLMHLRRDQLYSGIECGLGALPPLVEQTITAIGETLGSYLSEIGYRGWFDIDFVIGPDENVYLTEINARRASPAHGFEIANRFFGASWAKRCGIYAEDHLALQGSCNPTYSIIRDYLMQMNQAEEHSFARVIPTIASSSLRRETPYFGYVVVADNVTHARGLAIELEKRIRTGIGMDSSAC